MRKTDARSERTIQAIKDALLAVMKKKPFAQVNVSEVARAAGITRPTFYAHYANLDDVFQDLVTDFNNEMRVLRTQLKPECDTCAPAAGRPFCMLVRGEGRFAPLAHDSHFMNAYMAAAPKNAKRDIYDDLIDAGLSREVVETVCTFQMNGCYAAASSAPANCDWALRQTALDTFIRGGVQALCAAESRSSSPVRRYPQLPNT